jgi:hypothetical protein
VRGKLGSDARRTGGMKIGWRRMTYLGVTFGNKICGNNCRGILEVGAVGSAVASRVEEWKATTIQEVNKGFIFRTVVRSISKLDLM